MTVGEVSGVGDATTVDVLGAELEMTNAREGGALAAGVAWGSLAPNTPVAPSSPPPIASATTSASTGNSNRRQAGGGF